LYWKPKPNGKLKKKGGDGESRLDHKVEGLSNGKGRIAGKGKEEELSVRGGEKGEGKISKV